MMKIQYFCHPRIQKVIERYKQKDPNVTMHHVDSFLMMLRFEKQLLKCASLIPQNSRVLDIGCGLGHTTAILNIIRPDLYIVGIDLQRYKSWELYTDFTCQFQVSDAENTKFPNEYFDAVLSFGVMEHVHDEDKMLQEIYRILKKGGQSFIFHLPNYYSIDEWAASKMKLWFHDRRYREKQILHFMQTNGFDVRKIGREQFIPAQVDQISKTAGKVFNRCYSFIDSLDQFLVKTPLNRIAQSYYIFAVKK